MATHRPSVPAFPGNSNVTYNATGMNLREYFAAHAPPCPPEFPFHDLLDRHFQWPWYYADRVLAAAREGENELTSPPQEFVGSGPKPPLLLNGVYHCPCGHKHSRGPINGVDSYRCLWCGETHRVPSKLLEVGAGLAHIALERERQIAKGFDAAHDDQHTDQSILHAAGWIINDLEDRATHESDADPDDVADSSWPERLAVHVREKYGDDKIKRLAIAGALIVAEMERLIRGKVVGS